MPYRRIDILCQHQRRRPGDSWLCLISLFSTLCVYIWAWLVDLLFLAPLTKLPLALGNFAWPVLQHIHCSAMLQMMMIIINNNNTNTNNNNYYYNDNKLLQRLWRSNQDIMPIFMVVKNNGQLTNQILFKICTVNLIARYGAVIDPRAITGAVLFWLIMWMF